ncbi:MAG: hypothetical protein IPQ13_05840 [Holophagaceae bacterium]|nr:hypothetical protein [Holophagaceae bacterium]
MAATDMRKTLRPDSKGRITLGSLANGASCFKAFKDKKGRIVLEPQIEVPAIEAWLWKNPAAMEAVQKGLKDSAEGKLVDRGSFAKYADEIDG